MPPRYRNRVHQLTLKLRQLLGEKQVDCNDPAAHKNFFVGPAVLRAYGIPYHVLVQRPGDLVFTMPDCYHEGFNTDLNVASAVNFADPHWIRFREAYLLRQKKQLCHCPSCQRTETFQALNKLLKEDLLPFAPDIGKCIGPSYDEKIYIYLYS